MAAAVVKKDGIRKRTFPQSSTKHMLSTPYHLQWPVLKNGGNKKIVNEITRTLGSFHFELLCAKTRKTKDDKERAEKKKQRSSLVLGINEVTKALEKGTLKLVLVDKSIQPAALLEHLLLLCATRKVPACAITGMNESTFPPLLGVRKVSAFAFKDTGTPTVFDDLVEFITTIVEPLYVPWLHSKIEGDTPTTGNHGIGTADEESDEAHLPGGQDMHEKKRRMEEDSMVVETDVVNLQCAGDSAVNASDTNNSSMCLGRINNTAVKKGGMNNSVSNMPGTGTCNDDDDDVARVQANDNSTVNSQGNKNSKVQADTIVTNPSGKRKRRNRPRKSSKTNQNNVVLAYLRPCVKSFDIGKDTRNQGK